MLLFHVEKYCRPKYTWHMAPNSRFLSALYNILLQIKHLCAISYTTGVYISTPSWNLCATARVTLYHPTFIGEQCTITPMSRVS